MSNEQNPVDDVTDDLDAFSAEFFGQNKAPKEPASSEEAEDEDVTDVGAPEDTHSGDDTSANEEDDTDEEDEGQEPEPKPKKSRFQERIDELTSKAREAERERDALMARLEKLEQKETPTPTAKVVENTGPAPDDTNADGTEKYPLGEFDPQYIRDLTRFTLQEERNALKAQEEEDRAKQEMSAEREALQADWEEKLGPAQERYPDFQEKGETLINAFDGIDQNYAEYLTTTLMSLDYGTDVLYYLANNLDEAKKIVASGPAKATVALGRIEAKFAYAEEEKQKARPKISKAPTPPTHLNKGSAVVKAEVPDDTDDLDAFAEKLFSKKRRY